MISWISWVSVGLMIVVFLYAIFSVYLKKPLGLYMSAGFHIILGLLSLSSMGYYVLALAVLEIIAGIVMTIKYRRADE